MKQDVYGLLYQKLSRFFNERHALIVPTEENYTAYGTLSCVDDFGCVIRCDHQVLRCGSQSFIIRLQERGKQ